MRGRRPARGERLQSAPCFRSSGVARGEDEEHQEIDHEDLGDRGGGAAEAEGARDNGREEEDQGGLENGEGITGFCRRAAGRSRR